MATNYASKYDLRFLTGPILDQGQEGSCVENGIVTSIDLIMREMGHPTAPLSRQQLYNDQRSAINKFDVDYGSVVDVTLNLAKNNGIAYESSFKYGPDTLFKHPSAAVELEASQHKVTSWTSLSVYTTMYGFADEVRQMLSQGKPVMASIMVHDYLFNEKGPLAQQVNTGFTGSTKQGHFVTIVGMDDNLNGGSYIIQNSWGTQWGDNGYGTISYKQFAVTADHSDLKGLYTINGFNGIDTTYTTNRVSIAQDYALVLHRAGEIAGVDWYATRIGPNLSNTQVIDCMLNSPEGKFIFGNDNNSQFVEHCYNNILGRHSDVGGLAFWTSILDTGITRGTLMATMIDGVNHSTNDTNSQHYLQNMSNIASYMSIALQYNGNTAVNTGHELDLVTDNVNQIEILKVGIVEDFGYIPHHA